MSFDTYIESEILNVVFIETYKLRYENSAPLDSTAIRSKTT
jgi:hypothetical protein